MQGKITLISTVCPDYPNDGKEYTFQGQLGAGISLTAMSHLSRVPELVGALSQDERKFDWLILVADLPEVTTLQQEFFERVAGSKEGYLRQCAGSAEAIKAITNGISTVNTFSGFYGQQKIDYLGLQEKVAKIILRHQEEDQKFRSSFASYMLARQNLAEKFRGRALNREEHKLAAAHGMSLYITHGTLIRKLFLNQKIIVINHNTPNLQNFFLSNLVPGHEEMLNTPKFPIGIIDDELY
jgi:hypothetical protein